ncbi:MAG: DinB family protein [Anaerolineales bacterium]
MTLGELQSYLHALDDLRAQVAGIIKNVPAEGLNWRPSLPAGADPTNSLAVLAVHVAGSERFWIAESIGNQPATRDRDAEFKYVATSADEALAKLDAISEETRQVLGKLEPEDLAGNFMKDDHAVPVRWSIQHVIYHYALHIGHMQLTYQLWNEGKASTSPRWFNRLPK